VEAGVVEGGAEPVARPGQDNDAVVRVMGYFVERSA